MIKKDYFVIRLSSWRICKDLRERLSLHRVRLLCCRRWLQIPFTNECPTDSEYLFYSPINKLHNLIDSPNLTEEQVDAFNSKSSHLSEPTGKGDCFRHAWTDDKNKRLDTFWFTDIRFGEKSICNMERADMKKTLSSERIAFMHSQNR